MLLLPVQRPELDAIYRQTVGRKSRTICVTAANAGEGVSALAMALARRGAAAGLRVLLVDANLQRPATSAKLGLRPAHWSPIDHSAAAAVAFIDEIELGVLPASVTVDPVAVRDTDNWRQMFEVDLVSYDLIVVDAPPVSSVSDRAIPTEAMAAACAATVLVVLAGVTAERHVRGAVERLSTAGATVCGAVFNDRLNPSLSEELCREVDRFKRIAPGLTARVRNVINRSAILNLQM